jgi:peptidoglycan/xylan/chitin deacetylase (PgdA/CDA1 family)
LALEELPALRRKGIDLGSHTYSHQILTQIPLEAAAKELRSSRAAIEGALLSPCETFAYPNGNCSLEIRNLVAQAGYKMAFTTQTGLWTSGCDPLQVPRINISEDRIVGPLGKFSRAMFEYQVFWRGRRARIPQIQPFIQ